MPGRLPVPGRSPVGEDLIAFSLRRVKGVWLRSVCRGSSDALSASGDFAALLSFRVFRSGCSVDFDLSTLAPFANRVRLAAGRGMVDD